MRTHADLPALWAMGTAGRYAEATPDCCPLCFPSAEANAISENTDTLHLSPPITVLTGHVGQGAEQRPGVCERSCEELGSMVSELSGLRVIVNQLHDNLRKVVGARARRAGLWGRLVKAQGG